MNIALVAFLLNIYAGQILAIWVSYAAYDDGNSRRRRERADRDRRIQDEQVQEDQRRADEIKQLDEILNMA